VAAGSGTAAADRRSGSREGAEWCRVRL